MSSVTDSTTIYTRDFRLRAWLVRPTLHRLERDGETVQIEPKSMDVLVELAEHVGELRSRRRLLNVVWGDVFVSEEVLTRAVWELRKALGDDPKSPKYIETIPKKGYRLVAEMSWDEPGEAPDDKFPYRLGEQLGAGAIGEVYKAEDRRLERTVALKFLPKELATDQAAKNRFLREARAAAALDHPHIGVVHDIGESPDGRMYIAMAYYPGDSLKERIAAGPLVVDEAIDLARQIAEGLAAAHEKGIVHRDIKPANVMLTEGGPNGNSLVKIVDFGLARGAGDTTLTTLGSTVGTALYMSPEQARGDEVDPRSDLWSLGVTLYEMVSGQRPFRGGDIQAVLYAVLNEEPVKLSSVAPHAPPGLEAVIDQCLERDPGDRHQEAAALADDLATILAGRRPALGLGKEDSPYPGLAPFTEESAPFFFGRDPEVEAMWARLGTKKLLALIGPSGAGKTSFIGAGVIPARPEGWRYLVCRPGPAPFVSLGQALAPELAGDPEALRELLRFHKPDAAFSMLFDWRRRFDHALLVIDQFEELFTLNPSEVQASFADLLGRLSQEADIHVLLSLRDDFLIHCHEHSALAPVFDELTPLTAPRGPALRQAITEPATMLGYSFEEESIVEEMVAEVEDERGALPLVAFTAARLWDSRDQVQSLLTRESYQAIGGVAGALAQHAEATLDGIGTQKILIVRELFRNLATARGTRAARDREELLSVFDCTRARSAGAEGLPPPSPGEPVGNRAVAGYRAPETPGPRRQIETAPGMGKRESAASVLDTLIDARLLTSYEVPATEGEENGHHRIEIIHESLLTHWPRLVRWQTQDTEGAQLRDELRQAARIWDQHECSDDLLWTGTAQREFELWHERYPGGLTEVEESFARAMTRHAERRKRRRRLAVEVGFAILVGVLAVIGGFWRRSVTETRRAEAANLFSLAQLRLEEHPTAAIAYAIASLELADNPEMRRLALEALWRGPTEFRLPTYSPYSLDFSADGRWLATANRDDGGMLWPSDGGPPTALEGSDVAMEAWISPRGDLVAANMDVERRKLGLWSFPEGRFRRSFALGDQGSTFFFPFSRDGERLFTSSERLSAEAYEIEVRSWPVEGGEPDLLARLEVPKESSGAFFGVDPTETRLSWTDGRRVRIARLEGTTVHLASATSVEQDQIIRFHALDEQGRQLATADQAGTIQIWSLESDPPELTRTLEGTRGTRAIVIRFDPSGSRLAGCGGGFIWDLTAPPDAEPLRLRGPEGCGNWLAFDPSGNWLATGPYSLWPLARIYPRVLRGSEGAIRRGLAFTPDGERLVSTSGGVVRVWPLAGSSGERFRILDRSAGAFAAPRRLAMAPDGSFVASSNPLGTVKVLPLDGGPSRELGGFTDNISALAVGPRARLVAAGAGGFLREQAFVRVWDLESEEVHILDAGDGKAIRYLKFTGQGALWVASLPKLRRWSLEAGQARILEEIDLSSPEFVSDYVCDLDPEGRHVLLRAADKLWIRDLDTDDSRELSSHRDAGYRCSLDTTEEIALSSDGLGAVRVGPVTGGEPHLLLGHEGEVNAIAVSPDGRWIASGGTDATIRLWPMPDFSKPPLHTLARDELLATLRSLTNLRVVEDPESRTGWKQEFGPFPGWEEVPTW